MSILQTKTDLRNKRRFVNFSDFLFTDSNDNWRICSAFVASEHDLSQPIRRKLVSSVVNHVAEDRHVDTTTG